MILRPLYMSSEGTEEGEDCWLQKGCCMLIVTIVITGRTFYKPTWTTWSSMPCPEPRRGRWWWCDWVVSLSLSTCKATCKGRTTRPTTLTSDWLRPGWGPRGPSSTHNKSRPNCLYALKEKMEGEAENCRVSNGRSRFTSSQQESNVTTDWAGPGQLFRRLAGWRGAGRLTALPCTAL